MQLNTKKFFPQAGPRGQVFFAAVVWLIGAGMILRLAMIFLAKIDSSLWWIPPAGLTFGLLKAYWLMIPSAAKTITRINEQGKTWILNSFSLRTYLTIGGMILLGILLRHVGPVDNLMYQQFLAVLYLTIGIGLFMSDGVFLAVLRKKTAAHKKEKQKKQAG
jgi:hypothetical protein